MNKVLPSKADFHDRKERGKQNMEASAYSLPRKRSPCLFVHHHRHCHHQHHHHCHHGHHVHHHHPFIYHQYHGHNPESIPDTSPRMTLDQGRGFQLPPPPEEEEEKVEVEDEDEEPVFVMTDEWKEFFAKSEAKRRSERKKAKNKGRNTE